MNDVVVGAGKRGEEGKGECVRKYPLFNKGGFVKGGIRLIDDGTSCAPKIISPRRPACAPKFKVQFSQAQLAATPLIFFVSSSASKSKVRSEERKKHGMLFM
jgi:hypothetical protein